jgi:hypothetical protein
MQLCTLHPLELFVPRIYIFTALLGMCGNPDFAHELLQLFELPRMCMTLDLGSAAPT